MVVVGARPQLVSFQDQLLESPAELSEMIGASMQAESSQPAS